MARAQGENRARVHREAEQMLGLVPEWLSVMPETMIGGFWDLFRDFYQAETKIPNKYKELIGLGVSGATRCKYCALFHTEAARIHGATDEEIAEAGAMAGLTMMASTFINAEQIDYATFEDETRRVIQYVKQQRQQQQQQQPARGAQNARA